MMELLLIVITGFLLGKMLVPQGFSFLEKLIIGNGVVFGIFTFIITIYLINNSYNTNILFLIISIIIILIILFDIRYRHKKKLFSIFLPSTFKKFRLTYKILADFTFFTLIFFVAFIIIAWPVTSWDAIALYDFRGHFFSDGHTLKDLIALSTNSEIESGRLYYLSYPLLTSIMHMISYSISVLNPKWIYIFLNIGSYILFYRFMDRNSVSKFINFALSIVFVAVTYSVSIISYTNIPYLFYVSFGILYLYEYVINNDKKFLWLSLILVIISTQVRNLESFYVIYLITLMITMYYKRYDRNIMVSLWSIPVLIIISRFWPTVVNLLLKSFGDNFEVSEAAGVVLLGAVKFDLPHIYAVTSYYLASLSIYTPIFLSFLVTLILNIRLIKIKVLKTIFLPLVIFLFLIYLLLGTYVFSYYNNTWDTIGGSLTRSFLPVIPLILSYIGLVSNRSKLKADNERIY